MEQEEALLILVQIGQALHSAHQQHIVHGRVTPRSVLLSSRNEALLTDFHQGALLLSEKAGEGDSLEEAVYQAPEQLVGHTREESDQYALGLIAYEMFTGCKAFRVPSVSAPGMYFKTRSLIAPGKLNPTLAPSIEEAILKALSREPARRHRDMLAFLTALLVASATRGENQKQVTMAFAQETDATPITLEALETTETGVVPPYGADSIPSLPRRKVGRKLTSRHQRLLALIVYLVIAAVVADTLLIAFNFWMPAKRPATTPSASVTGITQFPTRSGTLVPTATKPIPSTSIPGRTNPPQSGKPKPTQTPVSPPTPVQVSLTSFFNNAGIGSAPGQANFDGSGYSYPADQLPASGLITVDGVPYQFPGYAPGTNDNISATGQTIPLTAGHYRQLFLLAAASWGPVSGTLTIRYTGGSTTTIGLTVPDWITGSSNALNTTYRYSPNGISRDIAYIYVISITLDATRTTNALVLPWLLRGPHRNGQMHVFALTLQP